MLFAAVAVLAIVLNVGAAQAASAAGAERYDFKGDNAYADFFTESGCVVTYVSIFATDDRTRSGPEGSASRSGAYASMYQYDSCTWQQLKSAYGYTELAPDAFQLRGQDANLATTVELFDYVSGSSIPVTIDVTWTATGSSSTGISHYLYRSPSFKEIYHSVGTYREASAVGTMTTSDGTNLTPNPTSYAALASSKSGYLQIG
jgi:hypothetical protein